MADDDKPETGTDDDTSAKDDDTKPEKGDTTAMKAALKKANNEAAKHRKEAEQLKRQMEDKDNASKSEMEQLIARFDAMEERATKAERAALVAEIADEMGLTRGQASRLRGDTRDELVADAEQVIEEFGIKPKAKPKKSETNGDAGESETDSADGKSEQGKTNGDAKPPAGKPKEKLQGGATPPGTDDAVDPVKLAKSILDSPF